MNNLPESSSSNSLPLGGRAGDGASVLNSKLLLFGEYGLMYDAMALSVPFPRFSGFLDFDPDYSHLESTAGIRKFYEYLKSGDSFQKLHFSFNLESLGNDLSRGLFFNSNIPQQYGVGSSGALVAALFSRYAATSVPKEKLTPELLKADFSLLESYFHGRSSGLDPLISYLNRPILINAEKQIVPLDFDLGNSDLAIALIDTQTTGATGPLVQHFIEQFTFPEFELAFERQFIPANNGCIESLLKGNHQYFFLYLEQLIHFQLQHFRRMIPGNFQVFISDAVVEKVFIKLLGSGGGGFLIAFAETEMILDRWSEKDGIELLKVLNF
ncbi:MAG TPA: mevalonate kinase [Prolixibacteraceae bacterium]|nr:mevalonate kinase [Prolixibacteraceae bacterium]